MKKKVILFLAAVIALSCIALIACTPHENEPTEVTVRFDYNYEGAPAAYEYKINKDEQATKPTTNPVREHFAFTNWYSNADCTGLADFGYALTSDTTYYAGWTQTEFLVKFDENYTGGSSTQAYIGINQQITQPADPDRTGYLFTLWYSDAACTTPYVFDTPVTKEVTLYAGWEEVGSGSTTLNISFMYNYDGAGTYYSTTIVSGRRVGVPAVPVRTAYAFIGWYEDAACNTRFDFTSNLSSNKTLYALWYKVNTFEAEFVELEYMEGVGLSAEIVGIEVIDWDLYDANASNGFYVTYLYKQGNTLEFNITAEEGVTDAHLVLRLTAEMVDIILTDKMYTVEVNGVALEFPDISLDGVPLPNMDLMRPFSNHTVSTSLSLNKGNNIIKLITSNSITMTGAMYATAPIVDCIYIYTNTAIDWTEGKCYSSNTDDIKLN